jgi:formylglycine-generating enzyme required for sulfatase activity
MPLFIVFMIYVIQPSYSESFPDGFVLINGGEFRRGIGESQKGTLMRLEDFEILDHPLTNREYKIFVDETNFPAPLHWQERTIPAGKEDHPLIFVNRYDAETYLDWLSRKEGRIYRLPTSAEFEYAARGGLVNQSYSWGNEAPARHANYDEKQSRGFDRWQDYLQPARWGEKNGYGLYGMAGNVWQMTADSPDPAMEQYKYRIENPIDVERGVMGGSWARGEEYLKCGYRLSTSPGIRHPDLGFRPVWEPIHSDWRIQSRKLCALAIGEGNVFLSWACLRNDSQSTRFHVYRATERNHAGFLVTKDALASSTFVDTGLTVDRHYQYYVRPVDGSGNESRRSEWVGVTTSVEKTSVVNSFQPLFRQGNLVPIFGDLDGDGTLDCVIRLDNGNSEMSQDPDLPVQLEAFTSYGRSLWRKDICNHNHCFGSANNVPFNVWDMDQDGKAEIITRLQIGEDVFVAVLNGYTGELLHKTPWPDMVTDFSKSSTRIHLSVGYLDGEHPAVITQTGLYENEVFVAYDAQLNELWRFDSFAETNGSGGHKIEVVDVDGDGKQEVFNGTTCLNHDGTMRWSIYKQHPDIVSVHDYLPERPGLEVFYIVETSVHAGVYMVDADSGEIIWKVNREDDPRWTHGHTGWTADIWDGSPGIECVSNRAGHNDRNLILFSADGRTLLEPFPFGYMPVEWDGDETRELISPGKPQIGNFNGKEIEIAAAGQPDFPDHSQVLMVADLYGDFRDEFIVLTTNDDGKKSVSVVTATYSRPERYIAPTENLNYRLWLARNMGGGYRSVYDQPLMHLKEKETGN